MKSIQEAITEAIQESGVKKDFSKKYEHALTQMFVDGKTPKEALNMDPKFLEMLYEHGVQCYNSGKFEDALTAFIFLSVIDATSVKYRMGVAGAFQMSKQYAEAINVYRSCIALEPTNPVPMYQMADCYLRLNDEQSALYCLNTCLAQAKTDVPKYKLLMTRVAMAADKITESMRKKG